MRQYVARNNFDSKGILCIEGKDFRYLRRVLRLKTGDMLNLRLPGGELVNATVCVIDDAAGKIMIQQAAKTNPAAAENMPVESDSPKWWLFQLLPQPKKMELIVRQAVECGVSYIVPVAGEYSQKSSIESLKKENSKSSRFERIIKEARQQSGSPIETQFLPLCSIKEAIALWKEQISADKDMHVAFALYELTSGTRDLYSALSFEGKCSNAAIFTGCEGGISPGEIEFLKDSGFIPVHFKTNILRCETAALYGMAALQNAIMEKEKWH